MNDNYIITSEDRGATWQLVDELRPGDRVTTDMGLMKGQPGLVESIEGGFVSIKWDSGGVSKLYFSQVQRLPEPSSAPE